MCFDTWCITHLFIWIIPTVINRLWQNINMFWAPSNDKDSCNADMMEAYNLSLVPEQSGQQVRKIFFPSGQICVLFSSVSIFSLINNECAWASKA